MTQNVAQNRRERRMAARAGGGFASRARRPVALVGGASMAMSVASIVAPTAAQAATFTVTNTSDSGAGSLRAALASAGNGDLVTFASSVTGSIHLNAPLQLNLGVTIDGPGAGVLSVDGQHQVQDLVVNNGGQSGATISGLTFTHGSGATGGAIEVEPGASLSLLDSRVTDSSATGSGGGIWMSQGTLTVERSTVSGNTSPTGGGIYASLPSGSQLIVNRSTISGNTATSAGSAIDAQGVSGTVPTSDQAGYYCNTGYLVDGDYCKYPESYQPGYRYGPYYSCYNGGLYYGPDGPYCSNGETTYPITKYYNTGEGYYYCPEGSYTRKGGGQFCYGYAEYGKVAQPGAQVGPGAVTISLSTISGNTSPAGKGVVSLIGLGSGSAVGSSTIASNSGIGLASGTGFGGAMPVVAATVIAGNTKDCAGPALTDAGYNLGGDGSCVLPGTGSHATAPGLAAALGALSDNGGPTKTMALSPTSDPAHAVVPAAFTVPGFAHPVCATNDQRGVLAAGSPCDVGAFQIEAPPTITARTHYRHHHHSAVVTFHCVSAAPEISVMCPAPVVVTGPGTHTVEGTVTAQDGQTAAVSKTVHLAGSPAHIRVATTRVDLRANRVTTHRSYTPAH